MTLPFFATGEDPGSSFSELLRRLDATPGSAGATATSTGAQRMTLGTIGEAGQGLRGAMHGTTIAALRFSEGIVMAGDRRLTEGHSIAHRGIEKIFPADRHSAIAIAGTAGPALEMVRLFQTQLEHYEKVEGSTLSLEGKANQLAQMVRANLTLAMEGLAVLPLFGGYDLRRRSGRIFSYDLTGGRYEELEYHATGSGGRDARTTIKLGYRPDQSEVEAVDLLVKGLYQAAEEDSATGGPDPLRGIYPVVAVVVEDGYRRLPDEVVAERFSTLVEGLRRRPETRAEPAAPSDEEVDRP
jgi:proteasome beta subunit